MSDLSPGGGFVFSPVHNVQFDVPPQNMTRQKNSWVNSGSGNLPSE
jgi:uroporphyrinogen decarboxylase